MAYMKKTKKKPEPVSVSQPTYRIRSVSFVDYGHWEYYRPKKGARKLKKRWKRPAYSGDISLFYTKPNAALLKPLLAQLLLIGPQNGAACQAAIRNYFMKG